MLVVVVVAVDAEVVVEVPTPSGLIGFIETKN